MEHNQQNNIGKASTTDDQQVRSITREEFSEGTNHLSPTTTFSSITTTTTTTTSRSYTCGFCKRGFSNAQALGGHMNIHRRDRAKLKQELEHETFLSLDIMASSPSATNLETSDQVVVDGSCDTQEVIVSDHLPIFKAEKGADDDDKEVLDLELRLGLEKHESSSSMVKSNSDATKNK